MWIRSQNKKELVNVLRINISPIVGDKRNKVIIWGHFASEGAFTSNKVTLGMYPTLEQAQSEIDEIEKALLSHSGGVYQMSKS